MRVLAAIASLASAAALTAAPGSAADTAAQPGSPAAASRPATRPGPDFDGDGKTDLAVWRPATGTWYVRHIATTQWGLPGDVPVPADFDGDGKTDLAVWRPTTGTWYLRGVATTQWGRPGDVPVPADFDGDGKIDLAVWRPANGTWYVRNVSTVQWGLPGDVPVAADYDNDGRAELAVWRPANGTWYVRNVSTVQWGLPGDVPIPADFDGDGKTDLAVWRPATGTWYLRRIATTQWGLLGDVPVAADYDGDGKTDLAVWRPATGTWYLRRIATTQWGLPADVPIQDLYPRAAVRPYKLLVIVEENHTATSALAGMPFLASLARSFGYASNYYAVRHPSLPNYLAVAGGSTFGVADDAGPGAHRLPGPSIFGQAFAVGRAAKTYAESMPTSCAQSGAGLYAVRHNPWVYFSDPAERSRCLRDDVPLGTPTAGALHGDVMAGTLPAVGLVVPNVVNDAHDASLAVADQWLRQWLPQVMSGADYRSGRLAVVVTFDEDDHTSTNRVLTVVIRPGLHGFVTAAPLTHYSLTRLAAQLVGAAPLRYGATAADFGAAFGF